MRWGGDAVGDDLVFMVLRACCACPLNNLMDGCHCFFTLLKRKISFMVSLGLLRSPLGGTMFEQQCLPHDVNRHDFTQTMSLVRLVYWTHLF